jgi:hypothetical protein
MKRYMEFPMPAYETSVVVEVEDRDEGGNERVGIGTALPAKAGETFEAALEKIKPIALTVMSKLQGLGDALDEVNVEFGLKLDGKWGVLVASGGLEAHFQVSLTWKRDRAKLTPPT